MNYTYQPFVQTRYIEPTNYRGARVKATNLTSGESVTVRWDDALDVAENHMAAARELYAACRPDDVPESFIACGTERGYIFTEVPKPIKKGKR